MTRVRNNNTDLIKCELCGNTFKSITNSHLKNKHNMTTDEYKKQFPNSNMISKDHLNKLSEWFNSDKGKSNAKKQILKQQTNPLRAKNALKAVKSDTYRKNHSDIMKKVVYNNPDKFKVMFKSIKGKEHHHYGKSNYQRWVDKYGIDIAKLKLKDWKLKNKIPGGSKNTKIELKVKNILDKNGIANIHQYDKIKSYYVDFYLPDINLVLEVDGDYWHANPSKYSAKDSIKYPGGRVLLAEEVWQKDLKRKNDIISLGYFYENVYGSEITEEFVLSKILKYY